VEFQPAQDPELLRKYPALEGQDLSSAVVMLDNRGSIYRGAAAVFHLLSLCPQSAWLLDGYEHSPRFAQMAEWSYSFIARHRPFFGWLTRLGWGSHAEPSSYAVISRAFLIGLAVIYLMAFGSLWSQLPGIVGSNGIVPAKVTVELLRQEADFRRVGLNRYHLVPTFCWVSSKDSFLRAQCLAGICLALLVILNIAPAPALFLLWAIYLSLATVCREFLNYQWDNLLLEAGFLAIFLAPLQLLPGTQSVHEPRRIIVWLLRWVLFRVMFQSGLMQLLGGDLSWRNLTAFYHHLQTQPLPTWVAWYLHGMPYWIINVITGGILCAELGLAWCVLLPRRPRRVALAGFVAMDVLFTLVGNYGFFFALRLCLCLLLLDDAALRRWFPAWPSSSSGPHEPSTTRRWSGTFLVPLTCLAIIIPFVQFSLILWPRFPWPRPVVAVSEWVAPFRTFNLYSMFSTVTRVRSEIILEASDDGLVWGEQDFKYKPGDVRRRPCFVVPHQPRLDWQLWFAALNGRERTPWFGNFCFRVVQGKPDIRKLLAKRDKSPKYVRAVLYEYRFSTWSERRKTGAWWVRTFRRQYNPVVSVTQPG